MDCFLGCFGTPKKGGRKRRKVSGKSPQKKARGVRRVEVHDDRSPCVQKKVVEEPIAVEKDPEFTRSEIEKVVVAEKPKKKVQFDPNVTTYEAPDPVYESFDAEGSLTSSAAQQSVAFPVNHRYQDCTFSDDDDGNVEEDYDDDDFDDDSGLDLDDDGTTELEEDDEEEEESFDSYFSLQMEKVRPELEEIGTANSGDMMKPAATIRANHGGGGAAHDRSCYVHSVLNPVENLSQWKEVKGKKTLLLQNSAKENKESALPVLVPVFAD